MSDGIREIYNEGRVCGLSAYELYVRKFYENDPNAVPPSEKAWLASMFGNGNAMILKINSGTLPGVQDFALPASSVLCGSNTLFASVFNGDCKWSDTAAISDTGAVGYWAEAVTSYGGLISNNSTSYPDSTNIPYGSDIFDSPTDRQNVINYCRIAEGLAIQQGTWVDGADSNPYKDLTNPTFGSSPAVIRLYITKQLTSDVKLLITGFLDSEFTTTLSGLDGSTDPLTNGCANGEFLGPAIFPWSSKIIMIYPNLANIVDNEYERQLPNGSLDTDTVGSYSFATQDTTVASAPIIDLDTTNPATYYQVNGAKYPNSVIPVNVKTAETSKSGMNVLAVYEPGMTAAKVNAAAQDANPDDNFFPPALYAGKVSQTGVQNMVPVDTAAPGTVKVFKTQEEASTYPQQLPDNFAFHYDPVNTDLTLYAESGAAIGPVNAKLSVSKRASADVKPVIGNVEASNNNLKTVALSNLDGVAYGTTGSNGTLDITTADGGIAWDDMLEALANDKKLDVLGQALKELRDTLPNISVTGNITSGGTVSGVNGKFSNSVAGSSVVVGDPDTSAKGTFSYNNSTGKVDLTGSLNGSGTISDSSGRSIGDNVSRRLVTGTLNGTSITLTDSSFTTTGYYDIYTSKWGVNPKTVTASNGSVTLTFRSSQSNLTVAVRCFERLS